MERQSLPNTRNTLFAWFPFLWSNVLFPGPAVSREPVRWQSLALILILPALLLYPCLHFPLFEPDEGRYAEIPREMLERNDWIVPHLQAEPYLDKPPLLYWCVSISYSLFGVHDWAARLIPALAIHACIVLVYLLGTRWLGERSALRAALLLTIAPGFLGMGRLLLIDGLFTFCTVLALFTAFEAVRGPNSGLRWVWWVISACSCGLAILAKGPVALILASPPLWLHRKLVGKHQPVHLGAILVFALVVAAINLPWYIALCVRVPGFLSYFFWEHNVVRFLAAEHHVRGVWFYLPVLFLALLPATLLLVPLVRFFLSAEEDIRTRRPPELGFLVLAGGWCVLFFTLSACKLPTYILPALPPIALVLGHFLAHGRWHGSPWPVRAFALGFGMLALAHYLLIPWYAGYRSPMNRPAVIEELCGDPTQFVVCYPRKCHSVAFYLGRDDLPNYRSKQIEELRQVVRSRPRTVILCTHRHSLAGLRQLLPPEVHIIRTEHIGLADIPVIPPQWMPRVRQLLGSTALGLCDVAVVEYHPPPPAPPFSTPPPMPGAAEVCEDEK